MFKFVLTTVDYIREFAVLIKYFKFLYQVNLKKFLQYKNIS